MERPFSTSCCTKSSKAVISKASSAMTAARCSGRTTTASPSPTTRSPGKTGAGYNTGAFQALFAPAGTPPGIVARLNTEVVRILSLPDVRQQLDGLGADAYGSTADAMGQFVKEDRQRWARLVKEQNFKVER